MQVGEPDLQESPLFCLFSFVLAKGLGRNIFHRSAPAYLLAKPHGCASPWAVSGGNHCFRAGHALQKPSDIQERYDLMPTGHLSLGEILKIPTIRLSSWLAASCSRVTDPQGSKVRAI